MAAATIRSFSARDQHRRRCTDVITHLRLAAISGGEVFPKPSSG
jgi:hypothetical protein